MHSSIDNGQKSTNNKIKIIAPAIEIPLSFNVLKSAEIWIVATQATVCNALCLQRLVPACNPRENNCITISNR